MSNQQQDRMVLLSKGYDAPKSAFSPGDDLTRLLRVCLRFETPRVHHHPDDNEVTLHCAPALYDTLAPGTTGRATWQDGILTNWLPD